MNAVSAILLLNRLEKLDCKLVSIAPQDYIAGVKVCDALCDENGKAIFLRVDRLELIKHILETHNLVRKRKNVLGGNRRRKPWLRHNQRQH